MKKPDYILILFAILLTMLVFQTVNCQPATDNCHEAAITELGFQTECPVSGNSTNARLQHLDSLKNRQDGWSKLGNATLPVSSFLQSGNDTNRWNDECYLSITGYIVMVKYGGSETCNCHSTNKATYDYHIEIADTPNPKSGHIMVCEVTRYTRAALDLDIGQLKQMIGKQVTLTGYLFYDEEHKQNAFNTNPTGKHNWRQTCWELHPVFEIK